MNERIKELAELCHEAKPIIGEDGWPQVATLNQEKFAELIVKECIDNIEVWEKDSRNHISYMLKQHFESGKPVEGSKGLHTCPYAEEINGDYETLCDCDEEQTYQCVMDI